VKKCDFREYTQVWDKRGVGCDQKRSLLSLSLFHRPEPLEISTFVQKFSTGFPQVFHRFFHSLEVSFPQV